MFLRSTSRASSVFSYIGVSSDYNGIDSDRWQLNWKLLGTCGHPSRRRNFISWCIHWELFPNSGTILFNLFCLHCSSACIHDLGFSKQGPYKSWVIKKKKKNPGGFTWKIRAARSCSDIWLLPLHQIVSGFCIDEWQEQRQGGVDKGWKTLQKSVHYPSLMSGCFCWSGIMDQMT